MFVLGLLRAWGDLDSRSVKGEYSFPGSTVLKGRSLGAR